jgi:hypothetical protein
MVISFMRSRIKTPLQITGYGLQLYSLDLLFRCCKSLFFLYLIEISYRVSVQTGFKSTKNQTKKISNDPKKIEE